MSKENKRKTTPEQHETVRYIMDVPKPISDKLDRWAEKQGFIHSTGNVNRSQAVRNLINKKCRA